MGNFNKAYSYLDRLNSLTAENILEEGGNTVVEGLKVDTPIDTGKTAESWYSEVNGKEVYVCNSNINDGFNVALGLRYGHFTRGGGYVDGRDYISESLDKGRQKILEKTEQEVKSL